ncbi:MAG: hypothetical protein DLM53_10500 [Candidatus Eremiobacter antarcticus]|nr:MAG: hypothetical protein DLM53_10500 [Candidatus Eremiobacter sp. RRmetagenome_bin22]
MIALALGGSSASAALAADAPPAPPDGTYSYSIDRASANIGTSTVTVKRSGDAIMVHETQAMPAQKFAVTVDETLAGSQLAPKSYVGNYTMEGGTPVVVRMSFNGSRADATVDGASGSTSLKLPPRITSGYVIEGALLTGFLFLPAQLHASRATAFAGIVPSKLTQVTNTVDRGMRPVRPPGAPANDIAVSIRGPVDFQEWYDPTTFVLDAVSVPSQNVLIHLTKRSG